MSKRQYDIEVPAVIAVVHSSGNMGKTTIARYLLAANLQDAMIFSMENRNATAFDGVNGVEHLVAKQFRELQDQIWSHERAVVDVGSSEFGGFSKQLIEYAGAQEDFCFVVPAGGRTKQIGDTIFTVKLLKRMGVEAERIRMVFSNIEREDADRHSLEVEYDALFNFHEAEGGFVLNPNAVIYRSEIFDVIRSLGLDLEAVLTDETDWREKIREANRSKDIETRRYALHRLAAKRLAISAKENLDNVFVELFS